MIKHSDSPAAARKQLTLYIPGLFNAPDDEGRPDFMYQVLETLLARSDKKQVAPGGYEEGLFALFGLHKNENSDLPVAAVTRMADMGVIDNDWWLRADPVHLGLNHDRLILADAPQLDITSEEANRLVAEIMEVFTADGWLLKAPRPERWYLKPTCEPSITTTPLTQVIGRDIQPFLPHGPDEKSWHTTLNEIQILLHTTAVNSERERKGKLPINSLWFWGGGRLPRVAPVHWAQVWSNEPVSLSLSRLSGTPCEDVPDSFGAWEKRANKDGEYLVVHDELPGAMSIDGAPRWHDMLAKLEEQWMRPLSRALKSGALTSAALVTDTGMDFRLTARQIHRWWRFRRPLAAYLQQYK